MGERGRYTWVILAVVIVTYFMENFLRSAPSALSPILIEELGLSYGMAGVLFFPIVEETLPHETSGIAQGLVNGIGTLGFSLMSPIYGALVDATGGYGPSNMIVLGVSVLTTLIFAFFTSETYGGANGSKN